MNQAAPEISIIIPAHNEGGRLPSTLRELFEYLDRCEAAAEVVVVDDASSDATGSLVRAAILTEPRLRLVENPAPHGKGAAVRAGLLAARGSRMHLFMDADLSVPTEFVGKFYHHLQAEGAPDLLTASRRLPRSRVAVAQPKLRRAGSRVFHGLLGLTGLRNFTDTQCGFKAFRPNAAHRLIPQVRLGGFLFDVELLLRAQAEGIPVEEVPVEWHHREGSSFDIFKHAPSLMLEFVYLLGLGLKLRLAGSPRHLRARTPR